MEDLCAVQALVMVTNYAVLRHTHIGREKGVLWNITFIVAGAYMALWEWATEEDGQS